jgi:uncharacterized protein
MLQVSMANRISRRGFVTGLATAAGAALVAGKLDAAPWQSSPNPSSVAERIPLPARPFPNKQVRLLPGLAKQASDINLKYVHSLATDRLAHSFRLTAGQASSAQPYGGWEKPDSELRGHFCGGHYLSACALAYSSTGDEEIKRKGDALVAELAKCQQKNGYLSAFPIEFFDRLQEQQKVWAPFYTIHKIMAGHLDMYTLAGNEQALETVKKMADWAGSWSGPLSYEHMQRVLKTEFGGMSELLANLAAVTGRREYLGTARRFEKKSFYEPLAGHRDELKGLHVNTHIPQVIGAARMYELTRETRYREIARYFWDEVTSERAYCTGGTSNREGWDTDPGKLSAALGPSTTEDCCAYNMMKLTRHLFGWSPEARYMDYYERLVFNHRLGTIDPETGTTMYYLPLQSGLWKTYGTPADSFWCCSGTGVEEFAKLNDTIYFHDDSSVYVNLFIASELEWPEKGLRLRQQTAFPREQGTTLTVVAERPADVAIRLRIPYWARTGQVKINGRALPAFASPSSYLTLAGPWKNGDKIEVSLPMHLHVAPMPDDESVQAIMYGPLVLAGRFDAAQREAWYGDLGPKATPIAVPTINADLEHAESWVEPMPDQPLVFRSVGQAQPLTLVPLADIVHEHYAVYWKVQKKA